jgi:hypothetical protein
MAGHIAKRTYKRKDGGTATVYRARIPNPHGSRYRFFDEAVN